MAYTDQDLGMAPYFADDERESAKAQSQQADRRTIQQQHDTNSTSIAIHIVDEDYQDKDDGEEGLQDGMNKYEQYVRIQFGPQKSKPRRPVDYSIKPMSMIDESDMYYQEEDSGYECHPRVHKRVKYDMEDMDNLVDSDLPSEAGGETSSQWRGPVNFAIRPMSEILADSVTKQEIIYPPGLISIERVVPSYASAKYLVKLADEKGRIKHDIQSFGEVKKTHGLHPLFAPFLQASGIYGPKDTEQFVVEVLGISRSILTATTPNMTSSCPRIPSPIFQNRQVKLEPEFVSAEPSALIYGTRRIALPTSAKPPVYSFLQEKSDVDIQPRQYMFSAFCSQKSDTSKNAVTADPEAPVEGNRTEDQFINVPLNAKLPKQTHKDAGIGTYKDLTTFISFPKLPLELRTKIWKHTAHIGHTIGLYDASYTSPLRQLTVSWPLLATCSESRQQALKLCTNFNANSSYPSSPFIGANVPASTFWLTNFRSSRFWGFATGPSTWEKFSEAVSANRAQIRSVALSWKLWHGSEAGKKFGHREILAWELEELILIKCDSKFDLESIVGGGKSKKRVQLRSLGSKFWGEESLIRLELGKAIEEKQREWEAAVLEGWDDEQMRTRGLRDLTDWVVPKVKIMEAGV